MMKWKNTPYDTGTFFVTGTFTAWQPLFLHEDVRRIVLDDLEFYRRKYQCSIHAYVIMPSHYHMVITLRNPADLHGWLRDVQSHSGRAISNWLRRTARPGELMIYQSHANGNAELAIWKEQARAIPLLSSGALKARIDYIHTNPVRAHLAANPSEWPWSSWRNYYDDDDTLLAVDRVGLG